MPTFRFRVAVIGYDSRVYCVAAGVVMIFDGSVYTRTTRTNAQVGDIVELVAPSFALVGLSLDQESPV